MLGRFISGLRRRLRGASPSHGAPPPVFMRVAYYVPRQVVLVTARHAGQENVWPMDWHGPLSLDPQLYGVSVTSTSYGAELIGASGCFVVNFVPAGWEQIILRCGSTSGRRSDKFVECGLVREEARVVDAPLLADALGAVECRVAQTLPVGDHTLFVGEVLHAVSRADAARLHHLDRRLAGVSESFECKDSA